MALSSADAARMAFFSADAARMSFFSADAARMAFVGADAALHLSSACQRFTCFFPSALNHTLSFAFHSSGLPQFLASLLVATHR
jgi:hypothetical protein